MTRKWSIDDGRRWKWWFSAKQWVWGVVILECSLSLTLAQNTQSCDSPWGLWQPFYWEALGCMCSSNCWCVELLGMMYVSIIVLLWPQLPLIKGSSFLPFFLFFFLSGSFCWKGKKYFWTQKFLCHALINSLSQEKRGQDGPLEVCGARIAMRMTECAGTTGTFLYKFSLTLRVLVPSDSTYGSRSESYHVWVFQLNPKFWL